MKTTAIGAMAPVLEPYMTVSYFPQAGSPKVVYFKRSTLAPADQVVYDNFEALFAQHGVVEINNTPQGMDIDFGSTLQLIPAPQFNLDYNTMSVQDKASVDAFINLVSITPQS